MLRQCRRIGNSFFILREFAFGFYIRIFIMEENETKEGKQMPSTYAHYRMGQEVREKLRGDAKTIIENASDVIEKSTDKEAALSYIYGVLNHFALDVTCHKYVDEKIKESGVSHAEIEVEFDRYLMLLDGLNPVKHSLTGHIRSTKENAGVITGFYTGTTEQEVLKALRKIAKEDKKVLFFLIAFFLYIDGVGTIIENCINIGTDLNLDTVGQVVFLLATQVVAFAGSLVFAKLSRKYRTVTLLLVCVVGYFAVCLYALTLHTLLDFGILAFGVGCFQGSIQSLSRSYYSKIIPAENSGEYFGIYDIFAKGASFLGSFCSIIMEVKNNRPEQPARGVLLCSRLHLP